MNIELDRYKELETACLTRFDVTKLGLVQALWTRGSDVLLWAIMKELLVPKIRQQDRKIKDLESRLKIVEDHLNREAAAEFSLATQEEHLKHSTKKRKKKV